MKLIQLNRTRLIGIFGSVMLSVIAFQIVQILAVSSEHPKEVTLLESDTDDEVEESEIKFRHDFRISEKSSSPDETIHRQRWSHPSLFYTSVYREIRIPPPELI